MISGMYSISHVQVHSKKSCLAKLTNLMKGSLIERSQKIQSFILESDECSKCSLKTRLISGIMSEACVDRPCFSKAILEHSRMMKLLAQQQSSLERDRSRLPSWLRRENTTIEWRLLPDLIAIEPFPCQEGPQRSRKEVTLAPTSLQPPGSFDGPGFWRA